MTRKLSYEEIGRRYGCSGTNIKNVARRLGIELPVKRKINPKETFNRKYKYCLNCGAELISYNGSYGKALNVNLNMLICGMKPIWNGKELVFIIDHIDGHASNNRRDNLRCICPNCDSQLDTYKSKNKCGERSYYRYHKNEINNNKN